MYTQVLLQKQWDVNVTINLGSAQNHVQILNMIILLKIMFFSYKKKLPQIVHVYTKNTSTSIHTSYYPFLL